jgi:HD-GYP domain-containing protein (c-di-GMP phosphodiesterase class II)
MEPIEEVIENEIEQKSIERTVIEEPEPEPEPETETELPKRKTKKERSPAQIAAFEKARLKRMEIANQKKQIKAKQKEEDNILKEQIKAKLDNETKPVDIPKPTLKKEFVKPRIEQPTPREIVREQVVNNYYYYGEQPKKRGRKKKIVEPETESETESESEEEYIQQPSRSQERMFRPETPPSPIQQPETYKELQSYKEEAPKKQFVRAQPKLKFSFV